MASVRDPNILEIAEICKSVSSAFEYSKNCGLVTVVDVAAVGAQNAVDNYRDGFLYTYRPTCGVVSLLG